MERLLIFGGTFNPIHNGHIRLYKHFAKRLDVCRTLLIPTHMPPHKQPHELADGCHRLAMCRLAVQEDSRAVVSDLELQRGEVSYTVDTLHTLRGQYPAAEFYLVVGSDMLFTLHQWREAQEILHQATICAMARHADEYHRLLEKAAELEQTMRARVILDNEPAWEISSTALRDLVRQGGDLSPYLPKAVAAYIKEKDLYQ